MRRVLKFALKILAVFVLAALLWGGWQAYHIYRTVVETTGKKVPRLSYEPKFDVPPWNGTKRINVLVLGSDNDKKFNGGTADTQSMIVVTIDTVHDKVGMLSIPRDFYVPVRGFGMQKIMLANSDGGIQLARATVEQLFGIPIHYYAWVGLTGFRKVIDTFGGVSLDVSHPILDDSYPNDLVSGDPFAYRRIFIPAGWQHMAGDAALQYARSRHGDFASDFGRSQRQQQILLRLQQKVTAINVLMNLPQLSDDLQSSVRTDLDFFQLLQLRQLAAKIHHNDVKKVVLQAPTYSSYGSTVDGQSIVVPNWNKIDPLIHSMFAPISPSRASPQAVPTSGGKQIALNTTPSPTPKRKVKPLPATSTTKPTPTPQPTATPAVPPRRPGNLFYVRNGNIFELREDGRQEQLTGKSDASMPVPSPDGRFLAYVRFSKFASDIWMINLRTHHTYSLTNDGRATDVRNRLWALYPSWIDGGRNVLFSWDRAKLTQPLSDGRAIDSAIWEAPAKGGKAIQLTSPFRGSGGDMEASIRPGGKQFVFVQWNYLKPSNKPFSQLVLFDQKSRHTWPLTSFGGRVLDPAWNGKGNRITFVQTIRGQDQVVDAAVKNARKGPTLVDFKVLAGGRVGQPAFTPDGRWVTYLSMDESGNSSINIVSTKGGTPSSLSNVDSGVDVWSHPLWTR